MEDRVKLEVSGGTFSVTQDQLDKGPSSKLVSLCRNSSSVIILDRPSESFSAVLALYQTGELHIPASLCPISLLNELDYWNLSPMLISKCCKERLERFLDEQELVRDFKNFQEEKRPIFQILFCDKASSFRAKMWTIVDYTEPTVLGAIYFSISLLMILASILALAYSTDPSFRRDMTTCEKIDYVLATETNITEKWKEKLHVFCTGHPDDTMTLLEKLGTDGVLKLSITYPETDLNDIIDIANKGGNTADADNISSSSPYDESSSDSYERKSRPSSIWNTPTIGNSYTRNTPPVGSSYTWDTPPVGDSHTWDTPPVVDSYTRGTPPVVDSYSRNTPPLENSYTGNTPPVEDSFSWSTSFIEDSYSRNAPPVKDSYPWSTSFAKDILLSSLAMEINTTRSSSYVKNSTVWSTQVTENLTTQITPSVNNTWNTSLVDNVTVEILITELELMYNQKSLTNISNDFHAKRTTTPTPVLLSINLLNLEIPHIKLKVYSLVICGIVTTVFFTLDFVLRILSCPCIVRYFTSMINIVDAFALASTYLHMLLIFLYQNEQYTNTWLNILEYSQMTRAFRLFRTIANVRAGKVLSYTILKNGKDLLIIALFLVAGMCIYASCFYLSEDHKDVPTIPDAWYWAIITMTTVGYGDMAPKTFLGRMFASLCATTGVLLLALTVPIFAHSFMTLYNHVETQDIETKIKHWMENSLEATSYRKSVSTNRKCSTPKHEKC